MDHAGRRFLTVVPRRRRWVSRLVIGVVLLVILLIAGSLYFAWYFSDQLLDVTHGSPAYDVTVLARHGNDITLTPDSGIANAGRFGLRWAAGYTHVAPVTDLSGKDVVRRLLSPAPNLKAGRHVKYSVFFYRNPGDVGLRYRSVTYADPLGSMPAWFVPGRGTTWVIAVHGLDSTRSEPLRSMVVFAKLGMPVLDIGYRNDAGSPAGSDHLYHLGAGEWMDLQAAVSYAVSHGAHAIVLNGYSMGGSIVEKFMQRSPYAHLVRAIVLDAPALDWYAILNLAASQRSLPGPFAALAERVIAYRIGLSSLDSLDFLGQKLRTPRPTLLLQGADDTLVPPSSNRAFAAEHPGVVTYVSVPGANHVQSWNVNPRMYDAKLRSFLMEHLRCRGARLGLTCQ